MLDKAGRALGHAGCRNVGFHVGEASAGLPFDDNSFDIAFLAAVIGEVPDKIACMRSLRRVLKPGGMVVFREGFPDPDRMSVAELRELAKAADLTFHDATGDRWHDVVRFQRLPLP